MDSRFAMTLVTVAALFSLMPACAGAVPADPVGDGRYEVQVLVDGTPLREFHHEGRWYVEGLRGRRYALRLVNHTGRRVEAVVTVDGLDVVDGKAGDFVHKRGYVLGPWQTYDVEGFRLDLGRVAAFRFAAVPDSYAARTGNARNVGVIGVAFFEERRPLPPPRPIVPRRPPTWNWDDGDVGGYDGPREESSAGDATGRFQSEAKVQGGAGRGGLLDQAEAPAAAAPADGLASRTRASRPGLGTEFGESRDSQVFETTFVRAHASAPTRLVAVRYDDRRGLLAQGVPLDPPPVSDAWLRQTADPFPASPRPSAFATPPRGWDR